MYTVFIVFIVCFSSPLLSAPLSVKSSKEATQALQRLMPSDKGFLVKLKELVAAGANLKVKDKQDMDVLQRIALWQGHGSAAKYVAEHLGMSKTKTDDWHETAIFLAAYSDNVEVVSALAPHYDLNAVDKHGMSLLLHALKFNSHRVAKFLLDVGDVSVDLKSRSGQSTLHLATSAAVIEALLAKGVKPNVATASGMTPLHTAVSYDRLDAIRALLKGGADPNSQATRSGLSPLHFAKSPEAVRLLLAHGADLNIRSLKGLTPAHLVSDANTIKVMALRGAKLNAKDSQGATPLDYARLNDKNIKLIETLVVYGAKNTPQALKQLQEREESEADEEEGEWEEEQKQPEYLTNLTEEARKQTSNPVIGRKQETEQVLNTLKRKFMRGAVLVGDAGVGKTELIKGIAYMLANDELPEFAGMEIYSLDIGSMWGSTESKWVGQLHKRVNAALKFIAADPDKRILFIDEVHQLLGGGQISARGSPPITDIIKPYLGSGEIKLIGITTHDEYQSVVEADRAIVDRLLRVDIDEPSSEDTLAILRGIKPAYEEHYGFVITKPALQAAVSLSNRYMADQQQPRKAISLLDDAAVSLPANSKRLTKNHVAKAVAKKIGISVATIMKSKNDKAAELLSELQQHIFGQDQALEEISSSIKIALVGLVDKNRPLAAFLFAGSTGVGKTETAKVIAQKLLDSEENLISVDMSGYKDPRSVVELTQFLTRAVKEKRHAVILLDELEKAHREVRELLLQLLDEGRLIDEHQRQVDFSNTIIIATTNSLSIEKEFTPELLNRFDRLINYQKLDSNVSRRLVQDQLDALNAILKDRKISVTLSAAAMKLISSVGYDKKYGAREMARKFTQLVKEPLAEIISRGVISRGAEYQLDLQRKGKDKIKATIATDWRQ